MIGINIITRVGGSRGFATASKLCQNKLYDSHVPLNCPQKMLLAVGSSLMAIIDPYRHDMVADFGETTGHQALSWMHNKMQSSEEGQSVLQNKPRLNSKQVDYEKLAGMAQNTFGYHYSRFYTDNQVSPDTRRQVQFVDDAELAYVMQRYRELHDIVHTLLRQPTTIRGEVIVKAFEGVQTRLPVCVLGGLFGPLQLTRTELGPYLTHDLPWALRTGSEAQFLMSIYFEKRFEQDVDDLRRELNIKSLI